MSITSAMFTGVSGLLANAEGINVIGNNLSNTNTIGFKGSRMLFSDMLSTNIGNGSQIGKGVQIQNVDNVFTPGSLQNTTNVTDLAIQGDGFFALCAPNAATGSAANAYYTKAGAFRLDSSGLGMVNPNGYKVLDTAGDAIVFSPFAVDAAANVLSFQKVVGIDQTGTISLLYADAAGNSATLPYGGAGVFPAAAAHAAIPAAVPFPAIPLAAGATPAVKLAEVNVPNPAGLAKQGGSLFTLTAASGTPAALTSANGTSEKVFSNSLELSNVDMATEFVNMITTQRAYSANSKTITTADEMTQEVLNLKR